jgi:hypothetical protein
MLASQTLNLKTVNGYSGTCPEKFGPFWINPNNKSREEWFKADTIYVVH